MAIFHHNEYSTMPRPCKFNLALALALRGLALALALTLMSLALALALESLALI